MKSFNERRRPRRNTSSISKPVADNTSLFSEEYKEYIDTEYEKVNNHLYKMIGEDTNRINDELDKQVYVALEKEFDRLVRYEDVIK